MSAATSGYAHAADHKTVVETRLDHAAEEIRDTYQDRFFWRRISEIASSNQVVRENPFILIWIGTLFYRRAIVAVRTRVLFDWTGALAVPWLSPQGDGAIPPVV